MKQKLFVIAALVVGIGTIGLYGMTLTAASSDDIPRITVENLKKLLDDPESGLVILDVRTNSSWEDSDFMIKSAIREDPNDFDSWAKKYPKEKTFVLYCT